MDGKNSLDFKINKNFAKIAIYLYLDIKYPDLRVKILNKKDKEVFIPILRIHSSYRI